jgi:ATP-dependent helicase/nuclease subunit B
VRDLETYRPLVEETFGRYRVPVFVDRHWDISSRPIVRTILDGLEVLRTGWQREAVVSFLRSPCLGCRGGEIDLVENLSLEAGYDFEGWTGSPWVPLRRPPRTRYTRGGGEGEKPSETDIEDEAPDPGLPADRAGDEIADRIEAVRTSVANRIRAAHLEPLKSLEARLAAGSSTGREAVAAFRDWMRQARLGDHAVGPDGEREIEAIDHVCDSIAGEAGEEILTLEGFAHLMIAGLGSLKLGRTPTRPDAVILAEVQRSRLGEVRRAIVGGLSAVDFPRAVVSDRYFNDRERALLGRMGLDLGIPDSLRQEEEAYFLYIALTRASERLVLTRPTTGIEGNSLDPSPFLDEIRAAVPGLVESAPRIDENPADLSEAQTAEELAACVGAYIASRLDRRIAGRGRQPDEEQARPDDRRILTVYNRLVVPPAGFRAFTPAIIDAAGRLWGYDNRPSLPEEIVRFAAGGRVRTASVGRLESFARCPYQHFARHMLRLTRRPKAEVTPLENGLLSHKALEILMQEGVPPPDRGTIDQRLQEVFKRIEKDSSLLAFLVTPGGRFRWHNTRSRLRRFLEVETLRLAGSEFRPSEFEREFGTSATPPLKIPLPDGGMLLLRGRIDRIDTAGSGPRTEALVIDYKSGTLTNKGRPVDLERGHDLQLAVYLLVVQEVLGMEPFGALYAPVLPRPVGEASRDPENPLDVKLIGLVPTDEGDRVTGGRNLLRGSRSSIKTHCELLTLLQEARGTLALYAGALSRGRIDVAPVKIGGKAPCEFCEFKPLCRIDEMYNPFRSSPKDGLGEREEDR